MKIRYILFAVTTLLVSVTFAHPVKSHHFFFKDQCSTLPRYIQAICENPDSIAYKVDYACVDFCLDYRHSLTECQQSCSN